MNVEIGGALTLLARGRVLVVVEVTRAARAAAARRALDSVTAIAAPQAAVP